MVQNLERNFCNLNAIEDEFHFTIDRPNYKKLRESRLAEIQVPVFYSKQAYLSSLYWLSWLFFDVFF